jgi:hypothetical protein
MYRTVQMNEKKDNKKKHVCNRVTGVAGPGSSITWERSCYRPFKTGKREKYVQSLSACLYVCSLGPLLLSEVYCKKFADFFSDEFSQIFRSYFV